VRRTHVALMGASVRGRITGADLDDAIAADITAQLNRKSS
jgi:hypothetical protein